MNLMSEKAPHTSVMVDEILTYFADSDLSVFFEGTVGAGGHAKAILSAHPEIKTYIACDRDKQALELAKQTLKPWEDKVIFVHGNYAKIPSFLHELGIKEVDGFFLT